MEKVSNNKNILIHGIHGTAGLLMGIGVGLILSIVILGFVSSVFSNSRIFMDYPVLSRLLQPAVTVYFFVFSIYGAYVGYIFEGKEKARYLSKLGAIAGILCGIAEAVYIELFRISSEIGQIVFFPIILAATGMIFGIPKIKKMVLLALSGAMGGAVGYAVYLLSLNLKFYLIYLKVGLPAILLAAILLLLAMGIPGAFISIGMHFIEGFTSSREEVPRFLKITRNIGIILTVLLLLISTLLSSSMSYYGSTSSSIQVLSDSGKVTLYVPIFLDNKGKVLEMYEKPTITGNAATTILESEHGKALKISGSGRFELNMEQTHVRFIKGNSKDFFDRFTLSMSNFALSEAQTGNQIDVWIYSEVDGAVLNYQIRQDNGGGKIMDIKKNETLKEGWQVVSLSVTNMMYD